MVIYYIQALFVLTCFIVVSHTVPVTNDKNVMLHLKHFGHLKESAVQTTFANKDQEASTAIKDFQKFAGINETGELHNEMIEKMNLLQYGVKEKPSQLSRKKRYVLYVACEGGIRGLEVTIGEDILKFLRDITLVAVARGLKWYKNELTWHISKYPSKIKNKAKVINTIARAFEVWSSVTPLKFEEIRTTTFYRWADIEIRFESGSHGGLLHRWLYPFDGPGGDYAHASYPINGGDVCFDDDENWTIDENYGVDLFQVAVHEFGHSLGLDDSDEEQALMATSYDRNVNQLQPDDIEGIQAIYGPPESSEEEDEDDDD